MAKQLKVLKYRHTFPACVRARCKALVSTPTTVSETSPPNLRTLHRTAWNARLPAALQNRRIAPCHRRYRPDLPAYPRPPAYPYPHARHPALRPRPLPPNRPRPQVQAPSDLRRRHHHHITSPSPSPSPSFCSTVAYVSASALGGSICARDCVSRERAPSAFGLPRCAPPPPRSCSVLGPSYQRRHPRRTLLFLACSR
jgi:hypothetical protein